MPIDAPDVSALERFKEVPYVIVAPAGSPIGDAARANAGKGPRIVLDESKGLSTERYREIVAGVQRQIDTDLGGGRPGYRIEVFDHTQPHAAATREKTARGFSENLRESRNSPFARAFHKTGGGAVCTVVGWTPDATAAKIYGENLPKGTKVDTGGVSVEGFQRQGLYHELGHCLMGGSEAKADAFSALMMLRYTGEPVSAVAALANFREVTELGSPDPSDDHIMARGLWHVVSIADDLRSNQTFMSMGIEDVAKVANRIVEKHGATPENERHIKSLRLALGVASQAKVHYIAGPDGLKPTNFPGWLAARADIPEIDRLMTVSAAMVGGVHPLRPLDYDPVGLRRSLSKLADAGDPTAKGMLRTMNKRLPSFPAPPANEIGPNIKVPFAFGAPALSDEAIAFKPHVHTVEFSQDQSAWRLRDRMSGEHVDTGRIDPAADFRTVDVPFAGTATAEPAATTSYEGWSLRP